jgi:UDP-N-acetylmuramate: L-alanyl-gamma-D-glutamyl-meso-diaminopimelate ligase
VSESFDKEGIEVFTEKKLLKEELFFMEFHDSVLLFLSSGNFDGINLKEFSDELLENCK